MTAFNLIAFIVALAAAVGLWSRFFGLLLIADDPAPTSSYPKAPSGPRPLSVFTDCPACGLFALHLFTPHASVSQCGYDVKMAGRECVNLGCGFEWAEEGDRVVHSREAILADLKAAEWGIKMYRDLGASADLMTAAYDRRNELATALELTTC